jgi:hypothetical protein
VSGLGNRLLVRVRNLARAGSTPGRKRGARFRVGVRIRSAVGVRVRVRVKVKVRVKG